MAAEHNLDLSSINGTGPGGRIVRADILRALEEKAKVAAKRIEELAEPGPGSRKDIRESIPIRGVRKIIFDNMFQSLSQSAQLTLHTEASAEALVALRDRLATDGQKVSFNAILVKTAAMVLRLHAKINASVEHDTIQVWKQIHIGLAMEANEALIVPVVRTPDLKTIREIDHEIAELVKKLRENRLSPDDLMNGTFTITNLGFADVDFFTPIIRPPESAILGVGRIVKKPVVKNDTVVPEARLALSLTFDHRIIDGAPAARFLKTIKDMIEDPLLMIG
jgi:pyruvate/2-oxoglutarate dehydrogenase complex dihydrolipoamide acyltransferase (E2) component